MIQNIFGIPVFIDTVVYKQRIDNALSGLDLKSYTKYNQKSEYKTKNWDCLVNTGMCEDLIDIQDKWVSEFLESIRHELFNYIRHIVMDNGTVLNPVFNFWVNYYNPGQWQERHDHVGACCDISFNYIHKIPDQSGNFKIHNPLPNLNSGKLKFYDSIYIVPPIEGTLIIFPSWLEHSVEINKSNEARISISGNIFLEEMITK